MVQMVVMIVGYNRNVNLLIHLEIIHEFTEDKTSGSWSIGLGGGRYRRHPIQLNGDAYPDQT
jgi:hypothetical protein